MSTIETNKISSNELDKSFVINNTEFILIPIFNFEKMYNNNVIQNTIMNVVYYNESKTIFGTKYSLEINLIALRFINKKKPNKIIGVWKQKKIVNPKKVVRQIVTNNNEIITSPPNTFYLTKEYDPYDAPVTNSLVVIDEKLKLPIPKHPMEYHFSTNVIFKFLGNKYFKKYFK